ncbi:uncharacterized protein LOC122363462 [Amphibalanus amphitrite]|uniref:uncharacterized protein LOC122363462 n=1 Tax=Amphibalanus amphitrite TaxID=1232801 RepID=UPI001C91B700|nr:uncharacterized protein LOC122363462 [Amphibalanus amphitrite]
MLESTGGRPWTLGETVMETGPRPADCRQPSAEIDCLNSCANTTVVLTGDMNLRMLPVRLSIETQRHVCLTLRPQETRTSEPNTIMERTARRLSVGGFYRYCSHDWMHTGVVFPDKICCLENKVVDCNDIKEPKALPFRTIFRKRRQILFRNVAKRSINRSTAQFSDAAGKPPVKVANPRAHLFGPRIGRAFYAPYQYTDKANPDEL